VSSSGARVFVDGLSGIGVPESVGGLMREWKWWMHSTTNLTTREREEEGGPHPTSPTFCVEGARGKIAGEKWDNVK